MRAGEEGKTVYVFSTWPHTYLHLGLICNPHSIVCSCVHEGVCTCLSNFVFIFYIAVCIDIDICMLVWKPKVNVRYLLPCPPYFLRQDLSLNQATADAWHTSFYPDRLANEL